MLPLPRLCSTPFGRRAGGCRAGSLSCDPADQRILPTPDRRLVCARGTLLHQLPRVVGPLLGPGSSHSAPIAAWAGIPIPLAVFPVLTFAFGAAWGRSSWLAGATLLLALGMDQCC